MDDADKRESGASEQPPPKIKAEDNPWYLLATLYGVPECSEDEPQGKNRVAWNRYFAANLDEKTRAKLIENKRRPAEELTPFSPKELQEIEKAFRERCKASAKKPAPPASYANIDFSNVEFEFGVSLAGYLFSRRTVFDGATFSFWADFGGATFSAEANFGGATFSHEAHFTGATFSDRVEFGGATFSDWAYFQGAAFSGWAQFGGAAFSGAAYFDDAIFSDEAFFHGVAFSGGVYFRGAAFSGAAYFGRATFSGWVFFAGATFSDWASFDGAAFSRAGFPKVTFARTSSFVNAEMKDETSFEGAIFEKEPPRFFGAKLHQGTVWRGIKSWPLPKDKEDAGAFIDAYACLKLEMDRLKKHEDELDFFTLELQSRRAVLGPWRGLLITLYGLISGYGRSYARPLYALFVVVAIGALVLLLSGAVTPRQSPGLSIANTLNVFSFRRDFFDPNIIERMPAPLQIFAAVQTILGTILLFLFGLGIRNKFRMK